MCGRYSLGQPRFISKLVHAQRSSHSAVCHSQKHFSETSVIVLPTLSPLVLCLLQIFVDIVNLRLQPLLPLLRRKVRVIFCRSLLHKHTHTTPTTTETHTQTVKSPEHHVYNNHMNSDHRLSSSFPPLDRHLHTHTHTQVNAANAGC